jgi:hypothetical protein
MDVKRVKPHPADCQDRGLNIFVAALDRGIG